MTEEYWFTTEQGIRGHYADLRQVEAEEARLRMQRLNKAENDMIDALRKSKAKYNIDEDDEEEAMVAHMRDGDGSDIDDDGSELEPPYTPEELARRIRGN